MVKQIHPSTHAHAVLMDLFTFAGCVQFYKGQPALFRPMAFEMAIRTALSGVGLCSVPQEPSAPAASSPRGSSPGLCRCAGLVGVGSFWCAWSLSGAFPSRWCHCSWVWFVLVFCTRAPSQGSCARGGLQPSSLPCHGIREAARASGSSEFVTNTLMEKLMTKLRKKRQIFHPGKGINEEVTVTEWWADLKKGVWGFLEEEKVGSSPVCPTRDQAHGAVCWEVAPCSPAGVGMK